MSADRNHDPSQDQQNHHSNEPSIHPRNALQPVHTGGGPASTSEQAAEPQQQPQQALDEGDTPMAPLYWIAPLTGGLYGLAIRYLAGWAGPFLQSIGVNSRMAGVMSIGFIMLTPVILGALTVYLLRNTRPSWMATFFTPWIATALMMMGSMLTLMEGSICVVILSPVFLVLSSLGGLLMRAILNVMEVQGRHIGGLAVLPLLALVVEGPVTPQDRWQRIERSTVVAAAPQRVWNEIVQARDIRREELKPTLAHLIGVPRPVEGINHTTAQGEVRESRWERGVHFRGRVTDRVEGRTLAWRYEFSPDSFPPGTMDDHVVLGGQYLDLGETRFTLTPIDAGHTRLDVVAHYRVTSTINVYAVPVADLLGRDFVDMLLDLYRRRSEAAGPLAFGPPA